MSQPGTPCKLTADQRLLKDNVKFGLVNKNMVVHALAAGEAEAEKERVQAEKANRQKEKKSLRQVGPMAQGQDV